MVTHAVKRLREAIGRPWMEGVGLADYYDGPVSGVTRLEPCEGTFSFDMLDWNGGHGTRIYALRVLAEEDYQEFLRVAASLPRQPEDGTGYDRLQSIRRRAGPVVLIIAVDIYSNVGLAAWEVTPVEQDAWDFTPYFDDAIPEQSHDWFALLGLTRSRPR
ncbi:MAG: hypothetical protein ACK47B_15775 [Armatimonadota bacterium]